MRELRIELTMFHKYFNDLIEKKIKTCQCSPFGAKMWNRDVRGKEFPCPAVPTPSLMSFPARPCPCISHFNYPDRPPASRESSRPSPTRPPVDYTARPRPPRVTREIFSLLQNFIFL
jgi:hypothetical protein